MLNQSIGGSPIQSHTVSLANDLFWIQGRMEMLGNPHNYINQEDFESYQIKSPKVAPWAFTGLPPSTPPEIFINRKRIQFFVFNDPKTVESYQPAPRMETVTFYLPLVVIRGNTPFMGDAKVQNFLDVWRGLFLPVTNASLYYLSESPVTLPTETSLLYLNTDVYQAYIEG